MSDFRLGFQSWVKIGYFIKGWCHDATQYQEKFYTISTSVVVFAIDIKVNMLLYVSKLSNHLIL